MISSLRLPVLALCGALSFGSAWAQGASQPSPAPSPPAATITQAPSGAPATTPPGTTSPAPSSAAPASAALPGLVPDAAETGDVDEVVLPAKPAAILSGQSTWEEGLKTMRETFQRMREALGKAGVQVVGRPLSVFIETNDENFKFDAMLPIDKAPADAVTSIPELHFGTTPSGKAYRFVHKGPYDEIDATYETITAYLDAKDITAKDAFIEEYVNDVADPTDPNLEINIFVQPK